VSFVHFPYLFHLLCLIFSQQCCDHAKLRISDYGQVTNGSGTTALTDEGRRSGVPTRCVTLPSGACHANPQPCRARTNDNDTQNWQGMASTMPTSLCSYWIHMPATLSNTDAEQYGTPHLRAPARRVDQRCLVLRGCEGGGRRRSSTRTPPLRATCLRGGLGANSHISPPPERLLTVWKRGASIMVRDNVDANLRCQPSLLTSVTCKYPYPQHGYGVCAGRGRVMWVTCTCRDIHNFTL
jgi:hypothetical protein